MFWRILISTLFPYTTLFRSEISAGNLETSEKILPEENSSLSADLEDYVKTLTGDFDDETAYWGDRKSTRLNSSHITISYAVFCLKKKTDPTTDFSYIHILLT